MLAVLIDWLDQYGRLLAAAASALTVLSIIVGGWFAVIRYRADRRLMTKHSQSTKTEAPTQVSANASGSGRANAIGRDVNFNITNVNMAEEEIGKIVTETVKSLLEQQNRDNPDNAHDSTANYRTWQAVKRTRRAFISIGLKATETEAVTKNDNIVSTREFRSALQAFARGDTRAAEHFFLRIERAMTAAGAAANKEAAEAARGAAEVVAMLDPRRAIAAYIRATNLDPQDGDTWNALGLAYAQLGESKEANQAFNKAAEIGKANQDDALLADAYGNLGNIYLDTDHFADAMQLFNTVLELEKVANREWSIANAHNGLGLAYLGLNKLEDAREEFAHTLSIYTKLNNLEGMATAYGNIGNTHMPKWLNRHSQKSVRQAERMYCKSRDINQKLGRQLELATDNLNLGIVYMARGDWYSAEANIRKSLAVYEKLKYKQGTADAVGNLAVIYSEIWRRTHEISHFHQAEAMYVKSIDIETALNHDSGVAQDYRNWGILCASNNQTAKAREKYQLALTLFKKVGASRQILETETLLNNLPPQNKSEASEPANLM